MKVVGSRTAATAILAAVALMAGACSSSTSSGGSGSSQGSKAAILIGVPVPLSGEYASAGTDILHGAQLAAKNINASGGVDGKKIQIVSQDDACLASTGSQAAQKMLSQGIVAAAGGYCSTAALPELQAFHRMGIPYVMDASTNPQLTEQGFAEAFRTIGRDDEQGPVAASFITSFLHAKRVAVGNDNSTYAKGLANSAVSALRKDGAQVVFNNALTPGQSDYTSFLTKIGQAKPQVFYYTGYYPEFGLLLKEAKQLGLKFTMMGGDANNDPTLIKTAGSAAAGAMMTTAPLAQFLSSAKGFVNAYQSAYGSGPGPYSSYEYDAVGVVAQAIKNAHSTTPSKITAALRSISYKGITGDFHFDSAGDRKPVNYIIIMVKGSSFAAYKQFNYSTNQWTNVG
jgi:ABC-type branched-subunit amino acid transport system substrate-binding protein